MKKFEGLLLALILAFSYGCMPAEEEKTVVYRLDSLMAQWEKTDRFQGNMLLKTPDTVIVRARGLASEIKNEPLEVHHSFYIGSLAKQFTAMAILRLVDRGELSLRDTLGAYVPELPEFMHGITLRQMLNHTSGIPDYYDMGFFHPGMTNEMVIDSLGTLDSLNFSPGDQYAYSNSAYVLLSVIVERVTDKPYRIFMFEEFFEPYNLRATMVYDTSTPYLPPRALGHREMGGTDDYNAFTTGGGGIYSNVLDMEKWISLLDTGKLISPGLMSEMYSPAALNSGELSYYGFGWKLDSLNREIYQHSGSLAGFRTYLYWDRERGLLLILMSNHTNDVSALNEEILEVIDGQI